MHMAKRTHYRLDLAQEQLDLALELFLTGRSYVCALTLAGAAEEVFGQFISSRDEQNVLQHMYSIEAPVEKMLRKETYSWKAFTREKNLIRNAAKHWSTSEGMEINADLEDESLRMLVRACDNYARLGLPETDRLCEFNGWFYEHIVGV